MTYDVWFALAGFGIAVAFLVAGIYIRDAGGDR